MFNKIKSLASGNPGLTAAAVVNPLAAAGTAGYAFDQYLNYKNYQLQKEQFKYEKGIQQDIFSREDNATQRRVADLRAAGLSPVLAAGSGAGAGAVVSTEAPQIGKSGLSEQALALVNMMKMEADISRTKAEEQFINTQRTTMEKMLPFQVGTSQATTRHQNAAAFKAYQEGREATVDADTVETSRVPNRGFFGQVYNAITGAVNRARSGLGLEPRHIQQQNLNNQRTVPPRGASGQPGRKGQYRLYGN